MKKNLLMRKVVAIAIVTIFVLTSCSKSENVVETQKTETTEISETKMTEIIQKIEKISESNVDKRTGFVTVGFGKYKVNKSENGKIDWLVLDKNDDSVLLLSKNILDCKNYNDEKVNISWGNSTIRSWLNDEFLQTAFSNGERTLFGNMNAFGYGLVKGDFVSLLNIDLCERYFGSIDSKQNAKLAATATDYAITNGVECDDNKKTDFYGCGSYFLMDNGDSDDKAAWVGQYGRVYKNGQSVKLEVGDGIRPLICLKSEAFNTSVLDTINNKLFHAEKVEIKETENLYDENFEERDEAFDLEEDEGNDENRKTYIYTNIPKSNYQSESAPTSEKNVINLKEWEYGRTPIEWVYVKPNTQIISNNKPNSSDKFAYKKSASSGSKGCYMPVFTNCDSVVGTDYDGRLYCFEDYTKILIEEMKYDNKFSELMYGDYNVLDLLKKRYEMIDISKGVYMAGDVYVNIVYVDELDDIIEKGK